MRKLVMLALLLVLVAPMLALIAPTKPALADDEEWIDVVPKQGTSGFMECHAEAVAAGNHYRYMTYVDPDQDQARTCDYWAREDVSRYFRVRYGIQIDPSSIQITYRLLP